MSLRVIVIIPVIIICGSFVSLFPELYWLREVAGIKVSTFLLNNAIDEHIGILIGFSR